MLPTGRHTEEYSRHYCSGDGGHAGGWSRTKAPLRRRQGNGAIGTPVALQEEVEYGLVLLNNF